MDDINNIVLTFDINPSNLNEMAGNFNTYISKKCQASLVKKIHDGVFVKEIMKCTIDNDKRIKANGDIAVKVVCKCEILNPILDSIISIKVNDINKMGYSYKLDKLCIFVPQHLCSKTYHSNDMVTVKIIGKRVEETIICIGQPT